MSGPEKLLLTDESGLIVLTYTPKPDSTFQAPIFLGLVEVQRAQRGA